MTTQITTAQINDLLNSSEIKGYANEWQGRRIYINLSAKNNDSRGDRNHQLYIDLTTGELVSKLGKGITTRAFDAAVKAFEKAYAAMTTTEENQEESQTQGVEQEESQAQTQAVENKLVITKPTLKGSEKQIIWANDIINLFILKLGDLTVPTTATAEQKAQAQAMLDKFFAMEYASEWIEQYKHLNDNTDPKKFWICVKCGW